MYGRVVKQQAETAVNTRFTVGGEKAETLICVTWYLFYI